MKISKKDWQNYIARLRKINEKAAEKVANFMETHDYSTPEGMKLLIDYANAVATKYGEGAAELSCQMYDAIADASGAFVPAAEPAATATYGEIAKTIYGTMASTKDPVAVGAAVGRSVKLASVDTLQQNALRDGAEWAWIPQGDTCPFCIMLASRGWEPASKKAIKNGHADHIHNNCDCTYCVRFDHETTVEGYDPDVLYDEYSKGGDTPSERLNAMRRQHYAANKDYINAQKRAAYKRKTLSAEAEEQKKLYKIFKPINSNLNNENADIRNMFSKLVHFKTGGKTVSEYVQSKVPLGNFRALPADRVVVVLREKSAKWIATLTEREIDLIKKYAYNPNDKKGNELYKKLNAMLRGEIPDNPRLRSIADTISGALKKSVLEDDVICYRSVDVPIYSDRDIGSVFKIAQFTSTSVTKRGALDKPYKITIYAKKGTSAAYIEELSAYKEQRELLIDKDIVVRVISKTENSIELEII